MYPARHKLLSAFPRIWQRYMSSSTPSVPRPSASLAIINERNEVLLVHRNPKSRSFAGVHVFPGGNFDSTQDDSLSITAIRETFEESGLLITTSSSASVEESVLDAGRKAIHSQHLSFQSFLSEHRLKADLGALLPFTRWITPPSVPRRFMTQFFVTFLSSSTSSSGTWEDRIPTPDGGLEVISARFIRPALALDEYRAGTIALMPPQYYIMSTLADILITETNTREQRDRVGRLSRGPFGGLVINPVFSKGPGERQTISYEGDESRGGPKGRLHRAVVRMGKNGVPSEYELIRNFDLFTEVEESATSVVSSKL